MQDPFGPEAFTLWRILAVIGLVLAPFGIAVLHMILTPPREDTESVTEEEDEYWTFP